MYDIFIETNMVLETNIKEDKMRLEKLPEDKMVTAIRLDVRKEGNRYIGDLVWNDGKVWKAWQNWRTLKSLTENARCTFDGPIVRV